MIEKNDFFPIENYKIIWHEEIIRGHCQKSRGNIERSEAMNRNIAFSRYYDICSIYDRLKLCNLWWFFSLFLFCTDFISITLYPFC